MALVVAAGSEVRQRRIWTPCAALRPFVSSFELRDDSLGARRIFNPLPARTDCFLQFHLKQPYLVVAASTGEIHGAPSRVLVGPHTKRANDLVWTGDLKVFTIRFSPVGFRSLFGVPAEAIRNLATDSELVLGSDVLVLEALLAEAENRQMPSIAEDFLLKHLALRPAKEGAATALRMTAAIQSSAPVSTLHRIASQHNLSLRQMERLFKEFVGVSPKAYERLHRTKQALVIHRAHPDWDWASVAVAAGYFDQSHLIREFRSLNSSTPAAFTLSGLMAEEFRSRSSGLDPAPAMSHSYNRSALRSVTVR